MLINMNERCSRSMRAFGDVFLINSAHYKYITWQCVCCDSYHADMGERDEVDKDLWLNCEQQKRATSQIIQVSVGG
jgi:hypothetical protein